MAAIGVLTAGILSGCKVAKKEDDQVQLDIFQYKVEFKEKLDKLAREYRKMNPEVKINIVTVGGGDDYGKALKKQFESGNEPAIFNIGGQQDIVNWKDKLEDLSKDPLVHEALPKTLKNSTLNGKVYGLPYDQEGYGFVYNKAMFKRAGIRPEEIRSYDDFVKAVKRLDSQKSKLGIDAVFALPAKSTWITGLQLSSIFISPEFHDSEEDTFKAKTIDFKYGNQFKEIIDLQNRYSVQPTVTMAYKNQVLDLFAKGKVAIIQQGNWAYNSIYKANNHLAGDIDIMPIPVKGLAYDKMPVGVPMYWAINKDKDEKVKKAASDFLDWVYTSEPGKEMVIRDYGYIPAYKGYDENEISDPISRTIYTYSKKGKTTNWVFMGYPTEWGQEVLGKNIIKYLEKEISWKELIDNSEERWKQERAAQ